VLGLGLVEGLLFLGLLVVVVPALEIHPFVDRRWMPPVVGSGVAAALSLQADTIASVVVVPWVVVTLLLAAFAGWRWLVHERTIEALVWPASLAYLAVGAVWLLLHALGAEPVGVQPPFVLLTAVHFHYAGFTATLLAGLVRGRTAAAAPRLSAAMLIAVAAAPPIVAIGFTFVGVLQVVGAVVLTLGLFALAWLTVRHVVPAVSDRWARWLLGISAVAVLVPMLLAVQWAVGWNFGTPALSIPMMARTHGVANALGFALCGVLGWRRLARHGTRTN
jgi:hypothetical protein